MSNLYREIDSKDFDELLQASGREVFSTYRILEWSPFISTVECLSIDALPQERILKIMYTFQVGCARRSFPFKFRSSNRDYLDMIWSSSTEFLS